MAQSAFDSFGRLDRRPRRGETAAVLRHHLTSMERGGVLPHGNGRSYGDSCHNDEGRLATSAGFANIVSFDAATGVLEAEPGVMLHQIIDHCAPFGWFLPVTPGTRFVTLGGAVANDVHGKNHHRRGTFGAHVTGLSLLRSDGEHVLKPGNALFAATIGGMGLTGIITKVRLQMMRVGSLDVIEELFPFDSLQDYFERAEEADAQNEYAVSWLDQLGGGRGVLMTANHATDGNFDSGNHKPRLSVPFTPPIAAINKWSLTAFNRVFYAAKSRAAGQPRTTNYQSYFYPLDAIGHWNRLYGPRGLFQHQSVVPFETAQKAIPALLEASRQAGEASFLTVLKRFGSVTSPGLLSFPTPGYTLTLDFPNRGASTLALLNRLDAITIEAGGRVNPYKDARMSAQTFAASFPHWQRLEALRDPAFVSDFWKRTALKLPKNGNANIFSKSLHRILTQVS